MIHQNDVVPQSVNSALTSEAVAPATVLCALKSVEVLDDSHALLKQQWFEQHYWSGLVEVLLQVK
jgi:hypothetical protein